MSTWELIITGCGTSHGNPPWGMPGLWSTDPHDGRRRAGAVLRGPQGQIILIDVGPDLAHQLRDPYRTWDGVSYPGDCIVRCDGVLLTHDHADHAHGVNDLRHVNRLMGGQTICIYGNKEHLDVMVAAFPYCFAHESGPYPMAAPAIEVRPLGDGCVTMIAGLPVMALPTNHGMAGRTTGWRCGQLGYLTDLKELPEPSAAQLQGLEVLVLDMLREKVHPTHLCWVDAQEIIARLKPQRTVLTHMGYEVRYAEWQDRLPHGVSMAFDGWHCPFHVQES